MPLWSWTFWKWQKSRKESININYIINHCNCGIWKKLILITAVIDYLPAGAIERMHCWLFTLSGDECLKVVLSSKHYTINFLAEWWILWSVPGQPPHGYSRVLKKPFLRRLLGVCMNCNIIHIYNCVYWPIYSCNGIYCYTISVNSYSCIPTVVLPAYHTTNVRISCKYLTCICI